MSLKISNLCFIYMIFNSVLIFFPIIETQPESYYHEDINLSLIYIIPLIFGFFIIFTENLIFKNIVKRKNIIKKTIIFIISFILVITLVNLLQYDDNMYYWLMAPTGQIIMYSHIFTRINFN